MIKANTKIKPRRHTGERREQKKKDISTDYRVIHIY